jgi:hypothetical protein
MKLNIISTFALAILLAFACQTEAKSKKEVRKVKDKEQTETEVQAQAVNPTDTAFLLTGTDSVLISKKKVVETWDKEWSRFSYVFYNQDKDLEKWQLAINNFIRKSLYKTEEQAPYTAPLSVELIHQSLLTFKKEARRYEDDMSMVWNIEDAYEIDASHTGFASVKNESSMYTGGAHGMYGIGITHFDKKSAKTLNLSDFIRKDAKFLQLAEAAFRRAVGIGATTPFSETDYWFERGFELPDNFEISQGKITFIYNPYEVSNYANGVITFSMPLRQVKPYLKREI